MKNFSELQELVKKKGLSYSQFNYINGDPVYLSRGIREIFFESEADEQKLYNMIRSFQENDFGSAGAYGKVSRPGHEYGRYEAVAFDPTEADTAVWIHRTEDAIKVYFRFER